MLKDSEREVSGGVRYVASLLVLLFTQCRICVTQGRPNCCGPFSCFVSSL